MANVEKTVSIIFGAEDKVSSVASSVGGALGQLGDKIDKGAAYLANFAKGMLEVEFAVGALAAGTLAAAIKEAGSFGDQVAEISTLTGATSGEIDGFREQILNYSRDSKKSIDDINGAIYQAISLGVDYKDSLGLIKDAEKLAVAGRAELMDTTELLGGTLNAYGAKVSDAAHYSDVFFETVRLGKTTIPELSDSLSRVTGIAANAGIPIETLSAAIAALTVTGAPTEQAITGIRAAIDNIINPSKKASDMAETLGISFGAAALKSEGFEGIMKKVYAATGGNVEKMAALFGSTEALNAVLTLGSDKSGKFAESMTAMQNAAGSTEKAYEKMANNFSGINQNLANNIKATLIDMGTPLLKSYGSVAEGIVAIFKGLSISFDAGTFQPVYDELNGFAVKVSEFLKGVATALPEALAMVDFSPIIDAFKTLGGAATDFLDGFDPAKPKDLAAAIQFVVDSIGSMITVTAGIVDQFSPVWDMIKTGIENFNQLDGSTKESTGHILGLAIEIEKFGKALGVIFAAFEWFGVKISDMGDYFSDVAWRVGNMVDIFKDLLTFDWEGLKKDAHNFWYDSEKEANAAAKSITSANEAWWATGDAVTKSSDQLGSASGKTKELTTETDKAAQMAKEFDEVFGHTSKGISSSVSTEIVPAMQKVSSESIKTKTDLEKLPEKLKIAIELQKVDTAQFEAETKRISSMLDFKAKIDISQIEAETKRVEATYNSLDNSIKLSTDSLQGLFTSLLTSSQDISALPVLRGQVQVSQFQAVTDRLSKGLDYNSKMADIKSKILIAGLETSADKTKTVFSAFSSEFMAISTFSSDLLKAFVDPNLEKSKVDFLKQELDEENRQKWELIELQKVFTGAEISLMKAQEKSLNSGEAIFTVSGEGFSPMTISTKNSQKTFNLIEDQIKKESQRKDDLLELQKEAVKAQVGLMEARTASIERGDAIIKISGDGLAPYLEAFMWQILEAIQVRASQEGLELLLGALG